MPRLPRCTPAGIPLHLVQRGHNRQICFAEAKDYATYVHYLIKAASRFQVNIHAWALMTNHVHILATPTQENAISKLMQSLNRNYVCYFNSTYQRSGTLWEGRFRSCLVETSNYLLQCYCYIELNPVRAGIVVDPVEYEWSSYRSNAFGVQSQLATPHPLYLALGEDEDSRLGSYRSLFDGHISQDTLRDIRESTNRNLAFGSDRFKVEVEAAVSRRVKSASPGRPRKIAL